MIGRCRVDGSMPGVRECPEAWLLRREMRLPLGLPDGGCRDRQSGGVFI
jgi:hypothetical protein